MKAGVSLGGGTPDASGRPAPRSTRGTTRRNPQSPGTVLAMTEGQFTELRDLRDQIETKDLADQPEDLEIPVEAPTERLRPGRGFDFSGHEFDVDALRRAAGA